MMLLALVSALAAGAAQQESTREFERTLPLAAGQKLTVDHQFGSVSVRGVPRKDVVVRASIRGAASDKSDAEQLISSIQIEVNSTATGVSVRTRYPERADGAGRNKRSYSVAYDIVMPETALLEVRNSFGGVSVTGIKADTVLRNGHGKLELRDGKGAQRLENSFGAIEVAGNEGDVTLSNGNGSLRVADVSGSVNARNSFGKVSVDRTAQNVTVVNGNGSVEVTGTGGEANVTGSFGTITVTNARGANIRGANGAVRVSKVSGATIVRSNFGVMEISEVQGTLDAQNNNGSIRVNGVAGNATITTTFGGVTATGIGGGLNITNSNGSIAATLAPSANCQPIVIRNNFGPVKLYLPDPANFDVVASTNFGRVNSELPLTVSGRIGAESAQGKLGSGGCSIRISNSNGGIDLLKAPPR